MLTNDALRSADGGAHRARRRYADIVGKMRTFAAAANHQQPGDPQRLAQVIVQVAAAINPPTRLALGSDTVARIEEKHRDVGRELDLRRSVSLSTDFVRP